MEQEQLKEVFRLHKLWLEDHKDGVRANLIGANLGGANLRYCIGNSKQIKTIQTETYYITYTDKVMAIGCKQHTIEEWFNFDDETIDKMNKGTSLEWWAKWKPRLQDIIINP